MSTTPFRVLAVDDEQPMLDAYREVLHAGTGPAARGTASLDRKLFGAQEQASPCAFELVPANQAEEAVALTGEALSRKAPFAVAFIDMRMPPGKDGLWAAEKIRTLDPDVNIVIVTAYSDRTPERIAATVQPPDKLLYVQKPFYGHEIHQCATALAHKWLVEQKLRQANTVLEDKVEERTRDLRSAMTVLKEELAIRTMIEKDLRKTQKELQRKQLDLESSNAALNMLFKKKEQEQRQMEKKFLFNIKEMVEPFLIKLEQSDLDEAQRSLTSIIRANLDAVTAPFMQQLAHRYFRLSPTEIHIANLIKQGKKTMEISDLLHMSKRTVEFHRDRLRQKIGIKNKKANLRAVLQEIDLEFQMH